MPHEIFVEPGHDMIQAFDAMHWFSGARKLMALPGESNHDRRPLEIFQSAKHLLAAIGGVIGVTLHYLRFGPKQVAPEKNGAERP